MTLPAAIRRARRAVEAMATVLPPPADAHQNCLCYLSAGGKRLTTVENTTWTPTLGDLRRLAEALRRGFVKVRRP